MSLNRRSVREQIRDTLMERILDGTYPPGYRLVELQLAGEFESSQAPVREALRELEALRFVHSRPHAGTRVREVPPGEMRDAYRVRAALERLAAESAARVRDVDWKTLEAAVSGIERSVERHDVRAYVRHDESFHRSLVELAANPVLQQHWEMLFVSTRARVVLRSGAVDMARTAAEHRPILEAMRKGQAERAGRLAFEHANHIADCLGRVLGEKGGDFPA
ncbi:MAG TPA: GntR family transcriptional regulator [Gemmatimonadaceae bacterium]|nr:GntR family transcriptional regulator [Gemmatimonadaceae bacterium]